MVENPILDGEPKASKKSKLLPKPLCRAVYRIFLAGLILSPIVVSDSSYLTPLLPESIPIATPIPEDRYLASFVPYDGYDGEELSVKFWFSDGTEFMPDMGVVEEMKEKAISSGEPQILAMFSKMNDPFYRPDADFLEGHPILPDLPEDVLSEEELAVNGVKIIQAPNTSLHIRKQAFEEGGPLAELTGKGGSEKLTIVLVNGPVVAKGFMGDPRYDGVRNILPNSYGSVEEYRLKKIKEFKSDLESLRKKLARDPYALSLYSILELKSFIYAYENGIVTDNQLLERKWAEFEGCTGWYGTGLWENLGLKRYSNRTILIAVGQRESVSKQVVYFDSNGQLSSRSIGPQLMNGSSGRSNYPDEYQSYPNPGNFAINPEASPDNPNSYLYGFWRPGEILRHEIGHDMLIAQAANEGKKPDRSEYYTDVEAMRGIQEASVKWEESGHTDNSGYYFVFSLPDDRGGGYILTENQNSPSNAPREL